MLFVPRDKRLLWEKSGILHDWFSLICPSFKNVNILATGKCEAQAIIKGKICVRKHWAHPSCFQRTGLSI